MVRSAGFLLQTRRSLSPTKTPCTYLPSKHRISHTNATSFTSLEHVNSQSFTDHQIYSKLSETTIRRLMQHAFAVRQASQEAMKLAYQSGQASDYEKANSLDELA